MPKIVLRDALDYLGTHVRRELDGRVDPSSLAVLDDILKHAEMAAEQIDDGPSHYEARFVHSAERPIWDALAARHSEDPIEKLVVVSPFFEREDPAGDADPEGLFDRVLERGIAWGDGAARPRVDLFVGALGDAVCRVPVAALERHRADVRLHKQLFSQDTRRLHGKVIVAFGARRATILWGSPNFTPSALLRSTAEGGNAECGLLLSVPRESLSVEQVRAAYGLDTFFVEHIGAIPEPPPPRGGEEPLAVEVGEILYDPETGQLSLFAEVLDSRVARIVLVPVGAGAPADEISLDVSSVGPASGTWPARWLEEIDRGLRRLRTHEMRVVAYDADGRQLGAAVLRLNVRFVDALEVYDNVLIGPAALSADVLLVPSTAPPEQRVAALKGFLHRMREASAAGAVGIRHQASLDVFYRNVRRGLEARWKLLDAQRGSRFALLRWSSELRRALAAASAEPAPRRAFLVERVAEHIGRVLDALPTWHTDVGVVKPVFAGENLDLALRDVAIEDDALAAVLPPARKLRDQIAARLEEVSR